MSLLSGIMGKARETARRASAQLNKVDDLERIALAAAGAIFADGKAEDSEFDAAANTIKGYFGGVFSDAQVNAALRKATTVFEGGRFSGRRAVFEAMKAVETPAEGEAIFAVVLDVCDVAGGIGDTEMAYIKELATKLRVSPAAYGL